MLLPAWAAYGGLDSSIGHLDLPMASTTVDSPKGVETSDASGQLQTLLAHLESQENSLRTDDLKKLCSDLVEVGSKLSTAPAAPEEAFDRLGQQLEKFPDSHQQEIVSNFEGLRENVKKRMMNTTVELNRWLEQAPREPATPQKLADIFQAIDYAPQMRWYKPCGDLDTKVRFLMAMAAAVRAAQEHPMLRNFVGSHPPTLALAQRLASSFFTLREFGNVLGAWLDARLEVYNETWQRAAERAVEKHKDKLQERLSAALSKATSGRSIRYLKIAEWPMARCPLAREFITFTGEHKGDLGDVGQPSLEDCPPHSLRPKTLLHLFRLLEGFEVDESMMPCGSVQFPEVVEPEEAEDVVDEAEDAEMAASVVAEVDQTNASNVESTREEASISTQVTSVVAPSPLDTPLSVASENSAQTGPEVFATEVPPQPIVESSPPTADEEEPNLSLAAPPPVVSRPADVAAKKLQSLGFDAPVAKAQKGDARRSLVPGASMPSPLEHDLITPAASTETGAKLVRRKMDWNNLQLMERILRRGMRTDEEWKSDWQKHCVENALPTDSSSPIPIRVITVFIERNLHPLLSKEWARDLMYKEEGHDDEPPPSPIAEPAEESKDGEGDREKRKGSRSRDGSSSSSNSDSGGSQDSQSKKKKKKRKKGDGENSSDKEEVSAIVPDQYHKTRMCFDFLEGKCSKRSAQCPHAHAQKEMKMPGVALAETQKLMEQKSVKVDQQKKQEEDAAAAAREEQKKLQQAQAQQAQAQAQAQSQAQAKRTKVDQDNPYYKTQYCTLFYKNQCSNGASCMFAHSQEELRMHPEAMMNYQMMGMPMGMMMPNQMMGMIPPGMGPPMMLPPGHGQMPMQMPGAGGDGKKKEKKRDDKDKDKDDKTKRRKDKDKGKDKKEKGSAKDKDKGKDKKEKGAKEKEKDRSRSRSREREREKEKEKSKDKKEKGAKDKGKDSKGKLGKEDKQPKKKEVKIDGDDL